VTAPTARDDRFHPPATPDPTWGETAWFGFSAPERGLAGTVYPLFRSSLGVCALGVAVWDAGAFEPWRARYARRHWHLPIPDDELDDVTIGGLRVRCLEPLSRYRVSYQDGDRISLELDYRGLIAPHAPIVTAERGHLDQPCHVQGTLRLGDEAIAIDCYEMRDRSWGPRDDLRRTRASYCYGIQSEDESFLASTIDLDGAERVVMGFLVRDGEKHDLTSGTREVLARDPRGFPSHVCIEAVDRKGRALAVEGRCLSRLAEQATPGMFAWMSLTAWSGQGGTCYGQDQEVWSPDTWPVP
jgi:hypothetical protein